MSKMLTKSLTDSRRHMSFELGQLGQNHNDKGDRISNTSCMSAAPAAEIAFLGSQMVLTSDACHHIRQA